MKKMINVFAVLCVVLMFVSCAGNNAKIVQSAPCAVISLADPVIPAEAVLVKIVEPVMFDWDSFIVREDQSETLDKVAKLMKENQDIILVLEGFASVEGPEDYNLNLSQNRADAVETALVERGVSSERIQSVTGKGETTQFGEELSPNRRVMVLSIQ